MFRELKKLAALLTLQEKKKCALLLLAIILMGLLETTGIASIFPFMSVLADPESVHSNRYLSNLYKIVDFASLDQFLIFIGAGVLFVLVLSNAVSATTTWMLLRFVYLCEYSISKRFFELYLSAPYVFFLNRNTSDLTKNILTEVRSVIVGVLTPALQILTRLVVSSCILSFLVIVDPAMALLVFSVCGGSYVMVFRLSRNKLTRKGERSTETQKQRYQIVSEGFGGVKELKLLGREAEYARRFSEPSRSFALSESAVHSIALLPKYALEAIVFGGILLITMYHIGMKRNLAEILPLLALYAFAGYRLMPAFQQIFASISQMRYHASGLAILYEDHKTLKEIAAEEKNESSPLEKVGCGTSPEKCLKLCNAVFTYPSSEKPAIKGLNIEIKAKTTVGFVGPTGSGKTTTIDILLGLLPLTQGDFYVDGIKIDRWNVRSWQKHVGYVPQSIYLSDETISKNIAFGVSEGLIDMQAVVRSAKLANIHSFVENELPDGYDTAIGERGIRLSGGQRQRIGIARALYHDPDILVLDEATSSLDGITENVIMDAIRELSAKKTIIIIAHRLTTVRECDTIYFLDNGKITDRGNFHDLLSTSPKFREMAL